MAQKNCDDQGVKIILFKPISKLFCFRGLFPCEATSEGVPSPPLARRSPSPASQGKSPPRRVLKWVPIATVVAVLFLSLNAHATCRVVSHVNEGGHVSSSKAYAASWLSGGSFGWEGLKTNPWFPALCLEDELAEGKTPMILSIDDGRYPIVRAEVAISATRRISLSRGETNVCEFKINGNFPEAGTEPGETEKNKLDMSGARSLRIEGSGEVLIVIQNKKPIAGKMRLERHIVPALWRADAPSAELKDEIVTAWVEVQ